MEMVVLVTKIRMHKMLCVWSVKTILFPIQQMTKSVKTQLLSGLDCDFQMGINTCGKVFF